MPDPNPDFSRQQPRDDPALPPRSITGPVDGTLNQPNIPLIGPPIDPPGLNRDVSLVEEMNAIRFILTLSSSDSQWQAKALVLLEYVLMYSHGMIDPEDIPYPIPIKSRRATRFTATRFMNRDLPGMKSLP